uniref:Putative secreted protein n=1 Tax=Anopheles darlingi TaxID=43151 RepID=A0A2M4D0Q5_ANODA
MYVRSLPFTTVCVCAHSSLLGATSAVRSNENGTHISMIRGACARIFQVTRTATATTAAPPPWFSLFTPTTESSSFQGCCAAQPVLSLSRCLHLVITRPAAVQMGRESEEIVESNTLFLFIISLSAFFCCCGCCRCTTMATATWRAISY